jgi:hypothetical protein
MANSATISNDLVGPVVAYANVVARTELQETPMLSYLSPNLQNLGTADGTAETQRTFLYKERNYLHARTTLDGIVNQADTELELLDPVAKVGDIIMVNGEAISLDANAAGDNTNFNVVTRSVFTVAAPVSHADGDAVEVFGTSQLEHADAPEIGYVKHATEVTTYTDIMMETVDVSASANFMALYAEGQVDKIAAYTADQMVVLKKQLETRLMWSDAQAPTVSVKGRFDGAYERIAAGGNTLDMSAGNLDYDDLQGAVRTIRRKGGRPTALFCSDYQADFINNFALAATQVVASQTAMDIWGANVRALRFSDLVIDIIPTQEMKTYAMLVSPEFVGVGPKEVARHFHPEELGKAGDYDRIQIVGEYTARWAAPEAHLVFEDVAYS